MSAMSSQRRKLSRTEVSPEVLAWNRRRRQERIRRKVVKRTARMAKPKGKLPF